MNKKPTADVFDLDTFRIDPNDPQLAPKTGGARSSSKPGQRRRATSASNFILVPWIWMVQLQLTQSVTAYRLALLLLYEHWRNERQPIRVTNILAAKFGIAAHRKKSALETLERLGLAVVERGPSKAPLVTPLLSSK
jgi:hypothetical protein